MSGSTVPVDGPPPSPGGPPRDLPPVEPPSAGFILQLFVIPAVIVAVLVIVVALFGKLAEGHRDASSYLQAIRSDNWNVRWRAAYELANLIRNEKELADDPKLLGELTSLLDDELGRPSADEVTLQYVAASLGAFRTAEAVTASGKAVDPLASLARALAPGRPLPVRVVATESLARLAAVAPEGTGRDEAVAALAQAAADPEPELRQRAAFALGFFGGDASTEALRTALGDGDRFVRYNAANALTRRGDPAALPVLREMLSPADLQEAVRTENADETRHRVETIHLEALDALQAAARARHPELARTVQPDIQDLLRSPLASVRMQAAALEKSLQNGPTSP